MADIFLLFHYVEPVDCLGYLAVPKETSLGANQGKGIKLKPIPRVSPVLSNPRPLPGATKSCAPLSPDAKPSPHALSLLAALSPPTLP